MKILVTNDDGYKSASYTALVDALSRKYEVLCIAPDGERSWIGKSMTTRRDLVIGNTKDATGRTLHFLSGTPSDCVQIGLYHLANIEEIGAVVSGMNLGRNDGISRILSSGTIGAAFEGALAGIPSFAVSVAGVSALRGDYDFFDEQNKKLFVTHAEIAAGIIEKSLRTPWQHFQVLSMNIPLKANNSTPVVMAKPSWTYYDKVFRKKDAGYTFTLPADATDSEQASDLYALSKGHVSVSPLSLTMTMEQGLNEAQKILHGEIPA